MKIFWNSLFDTRNYCSKDRNIGWSGWFFWIAKTEIDEKSSIIHRVYQGGAFSEGFAGGVLCGGASVTEGRCWAESCGA